ncbi:MAG: type II secretion system protein GspM [Alphaproteobacteria bacterium]
MIASLSLPVRRFAALSLLAIFLFLLWEIIVSPISGFWDKTGSDNARSVRLVDAYRKSIHDQPHWAALLQQMQEGKYANVFLEGGNTDLASAKLQENVKHLTEATGGVVSSIQVLPPIKQNDLQRLSVRVSFSIPVEHLADLLGKYDEARPYLFLDNLIVTAPEGDQNSGTKPVQLTVNGELSAYLNPVTP